MDASIFLISYSYGTVKSSANTSPYPDSYRLWCFTCTIFKRFTYFVCWNICRSKVLKLTQPRFAFNALNFISCLITFLIVSIWCFLHYFNNLKNDLVSLIWFWAHMYWWYFSLVLSLSISVLVPVEIWLCRLITLQHSTILALL